MAEMTINSQYFWQVSEQIQHTMFTDKISS